MRRKLWIFVFIFSILFSLGAEVIAGLGGFANAFSSIELGSSSLPAARVGGPYLLTIVLVFLFLIVLSFLSLLTISGILGLIKGIFLGLTLGLLVDYIVIRGKIEPGDPTIIRRWAGRGAVFMFVFVVWVGILNPLLSQLGTNPIDVFSAKDIVGIFSTTGIFVCAFFACIGVVQYYWTRRKKNKF
ncbi:hypothetical protein CLV96_1020 [Leptospira meyeri]|uniref:Uncharacterized protein n=1 Tax=Leptospira meyeri TaxID=29508 RepID=A0A4R8MRM1_LEPME|nr:hypothetical protein [Leptospira meyeri]EKJ85360.1 hypothetical protein LEP1GSC017_2937 [Leptospira meyeri serovar Hardjo str. Went 5]TDY72039.1 hypothetical protein CLV96_1020 [Leptospira meyeri]TGL47679.1 hypothetical protein EHQ55_11145 [Leptospira meyeri]